MLAYNPSIEAAKARLKTAEEFASYASSNTDYLHEIARAAIAAAEKAQIAADEAQDAFNLAKEAEGDALQELHAAEASLNAVEEQEDKGNKRSATALLESEMHKMHRDFTGGKPPRKFLSLNSVPAIEVSGCGSKAVNGIFTRDGDYNGAPKFTRKGKGIGGNQGVFMICRGTNSLWNIRFEYDSGVFSYYGTNRTGNKELNPFQVEWDISCCGFYPLPTLTRLQK
jgi:hypothetical protein